MKEGRKTDKKEDTQMKTLRNEIFEIIAHIAVVVVIVSAVAIG